MGMALLIVLLIWLAYSAGKRRGSGEVYESSAVVKEVQQLKELVTVTYTVQKVVGLKEPKQPFGEESILLIVQAKLLGGVDLATFKESDMQWAGPHEVKIRLPEAQILHAYLDEKKTQVWDRQITWWTPWVPFDPQLEQKARVQALSSVQETAKEMGILRDARRNAEELIGRLVKPLGVQKVVFYPSSS